MGGSRNVPDVMRSRYKLFALFGVLVLVLSVFAPAALAASPAVQQEGGNQTDGTPSDGNVTDGNTTDGNVTDGNVTDGNVSDGNVTDGNDTNVSFGQMVSAFVHSLVSDDGNETDRPGIGHAVANFVLANNPAADKIPDHAGPPENGTGPPEHAGPPENGDDEEDDEDDRGGGPPAHAGPSGDDEAEDDEDAAEQDG